MAPAAVVATAATATADLIAAAATAAAGHHRHLLLDVARHAARDVDRLLHRYADINGPLGLVGDGLAGVGLQAVPRPC